MLDDNADENGSEDEPGHEHDHGFEDIEFELDTQSQIFLELRGQNVELMKLAAQIGGYAGGHGPLKPHEIRNALKTVLDVYAELYSWVDPEEGDDEEDDDEEEGEDE